MTEILISLQEAIEAIESVPEGNWKPSRYIKELEKLDPVQPEIIRCKDCEYGDQDEIGRWFCSSLGCQVGSEDGSGFCADAVRKGDSDRKCSTCKHADWDWDIFDISGKKYWFLVGCEEDLDDPEAGDCEGYEEWRWEE